MKFAFRIQDYQTDATMAVVNCFQGQPYQSALSYRRDIGIRSGQLFNANNEAIEADSNDDTGFANGPVQLSSSDLVVNIQSIQEKNQILVSDRLVSPMGVCSLDVEMETGTGKTYVYIKTMYELNRVYGWTKFIVVVPSVAIREGVKKSFEMTEEHFQEIYGKKIRYFVYDSKNLQLIDSYSGDPGINVMIINMQAFNTSLKEEVDTKESRIIYSKRDEFASRRPIDVIKANHPIVILDEPQKMGGDATQKALHNFNPLFTLNYSATHKDVHNLVYALDAVDAYQQKLVKKIEVKGITVDNLRGTDGYLYVEDILTDPKRPPRVRLMFEVKQKNGIKRQSRLCEVDDNLEELSNGMAQYAGYRIADIRPMTGAVSFTNGLTMHIGELVGDVADLDLKRIQIRETIRSHLEKEEELFKKGIKTLSLFFVDEVAKYRLYDKEGNPSLGIYGQIFEEEYMQALNDFSSLFDTAYQKYLQGIDVHDTHAGYFSIDKKGRVVDSKVKRGTDMSDDISAYDLILKDKERLLSFTEPVRFIFSHSALREGWDNPNVFQICTLKQASSTTMKRQEVGRGLRLCVDQHGFRMDAKRIGDDEVHRLNILTVVASESYEKFAAGLQKEISADLRDRPQSATADYFRGMVLRANGESHKITAEEAAMIYKYLVKNDYVTMQGDRVSATYRKDMENHMLAPLPKELELYSEGIHRAIQSVYDPSLLDGLLEDVNKPKVMDNPLNENFSKKEFQELWAKINHKYVYTISFDSSELIRNAIDSIDRNLYVSSLRYTVTRGEIKVNLNETDVNKGDLFDRTQMKHGEISKPPTSNVRYDLIGRVADAVSLTRRTVVSILQGIRADKFEMYRNNPEEFMSKVSRLINEQKAAIIVEHISYDQIEGEYDSSIFTAENHTTLDKALQVKKHIQPYVFTDGSADQSVEKRFAEDLESAEAVMVYAKLPRGFSIPTPVGNYSPDWAIAFKKGTVKHIFFVAETKGTMESLELRPIERAKISCASRLFNELSTEDVVYHDVDSYQSLLDIMDSIKKKTV